MAILSETDRQRIWRGLMRYWSDLREAADFDSVLLRSAVDAADQWVEDNAVSYNNALPAGFRTNATADQKALLLLAVVAMRFIPGAAATLRRVLGVEVD